MLFSELTQAAERLAETLRSHRCRAVFAESCTGGLVSAALSQVAGISEFHCGSAVVYKLDTKTQWLGVPAAILKDPGPVSEVVARAMAIGVLIRTPEAHWAASITGHLGPNAPPEQDGLVFIGIARRSADSAEVADVQVTEHRLGVPFPAGMTVQQSLRIRRQVHAAILVLETLNKAISERRA
jgi:PncC family amidohydrolase